MLILPKKRQNYVVISQFRCKPGLLPMPDSIKGCGPECTRDSDCNHGYICEQEWQRCILKPGKKLHKLPKKKGYFM